MQQYSSTLSSANKTKRKQVGIACSNCRRSKTACDEFRPCTRCVSRGMGDACVDAPKKRRAKKNKGEKPTAKKQKIEHEPQTMPQRYVPFFIPSEISIKNPLISRSDESLPNVGNNVNRTLYNLPRFSKPRFPSSELLSLMQRETLPKLPALDVLPKIDNINEPIHGCCDSKGNCDSSRSFSLERNSLLLNEKKSLESMDQSQKLDKFPDNKLPPINSFDFELPFRTVAEPTVDLFADSNTKKNSNVSFSDETVEMNTEKNPSLETLMACALRDEEI